MKPSSFARVFGRAPIARVIDFLLENRDFDYSLSEIAKHASVAWSTLHTFWDDLVKLGIVKPTRRIGRAKLYKLDKETPLVKKLIEIDFVVASHHVEKELKRQQMVETRLTKSAVERGKIIA